MSLILAADIGGTNIRQAIVDPSGEVMYETRSELSLSRFSTEADMISAIAGQLSPMLQRHSVAAVGIGFPGFFDDHSGRLLASPNLPYIHHLPLAKRLQTCLGIPVSMQNDALCAALGEHRFGRGQGAKNLLHITLGTGIGGGLILQHQPWSGETGMAMEFGHIRICQEQAARRCGCGNHGCVEAYASATAIMAMYREQTGKDSSAHAIYRQAQQGEVYALQLWQQAGHALGMAMAQCVIMLDIHRITVSGGMTGAWDLLYPAIDASLQRALIPPQRGSVHVAASALNDHAGLLGAALLACERQLQ